MITEKQLHNATLIGAEALWKLFQDGFLLAGSKQICTEVARSCIQCQACTDYGAQRKTSGTSVSDGPCDFLSIDVVGPLPADQRMEYVTIFTDSCSKYTILIPLKDHMTLEVSSTFLDRVIPYLGVPR